MEKTELLKPKGVFVDQINKTDKPLLKLTKKKRGFKNKNIRNESGDITYTPYRNIRT